MNMQTLHEKNNESQKGKKLTDNPSRGLTATKTLVEFYQKQGSKAKATAIEPAMKQGEDEAR